MLPVPGWRQHRTIKLNWVDWNLKQYLYIKSTSWNTKWFIIHFVCEIATTLVRPSFPVPSHSTAHPANYQFSVLTHEYGDDRCRSPTCWITVSHERFTVSRVLLLLHSHGPGAHVDQNSVSVLSGVKDWGVDQQLKGPKWHLQMHLQAVKCGAAKQLIICHPAANWYQLIMLHGDCFFLSF